MYQQITVIGNVGRDAELRHTANGKTVANFSVAVNQNGDETPDWFQVSLWGDAAEKVAQWIRKGRQVMVVGSVKLETWADQNGETRASLRLHTNAKGFKLLGKAEPAAKASES